MNVARHVQASAAPIPTEILPEIRQLKGGAQGIRGSIEPIVAIPGDPQHEPADRIRRPATVVEHVAPRSIAGRRGILTERTDEIVEQRHRQVERPNGVRNGGEHELVPIARRRFGRRPARDDVKALLPVAQLQPARVG